MIKSISYKSGSFCKLT